jgi:hypothetical protein
MTITWWVKQTEQKLFIVLFGTQELTLELVGFVFLNLKFSVSYFFLQLFVCPSSNYSFWRLHCYLLKTPLLSSEDSTVIFWRLHCYLCLLRITACEDSTVICVFFELQLLKTPLLSSTFLGILCIVFICLSFDNSYSNGDQHIYVFLDLQL